MLHGAGKKIYWAEKLSTGDILRFWARSLFSDIRVNYDSFQVSRNVSGALRFFERAGQKRIFFPVELSLDKRDDKGYSLNYRVEKELSDSIEEFFEKQIPFESRRFKDTLKPYIATVLKEKVVFVTMAASEFKGRDIAPGERNIICLKEHPLNRLLIDFYRGREFAVSKSLVSLKGLLFCMKPLYLSAGFLINKLFGPGLKGSASGARPAIWVEYYPGRMHAFWMNSIRADGFDLVNYLDRDDTLPSQEAVKEIKSRNAEWIDARFSSLIRMSRLSFTDIRGLLLKMFLVSVSRPAWLGVFRFEHDYLLAVYSSVFSRFKVKVLVQHQECSWVQGVQALAVERAGGIMMGYHWSSYTYSEMSVENFPQHIYFAWGKMMSEMLEMKEVSGRRILPSGIWSAVNGKESVKKDLFPPNVNFVISVFDSVVKYNFFQSPESLCDFYLRVLGLIKSNPGFGCIIKTKQPFPQSIAVLGRGKEILEDIEGLKGQKRLAVFESFESPVIAASASDLLVGYGINSACTVAAVIAKRPAVNWDCSGFKKHPFYKSPGQQIVFETLDVLEEAILKASRGDKSVGDYGRWERYIDHFGDDLAAGRVAGFLESYMRESIGTGDPDRSLGLAVRKYLENNKVGEDFYQKEGLWEDE